MLLVLFGDLFVEPLEERRPVDESKAPQRMNIIEILLDEETNSRRTRQLTSIQPFGRCQNLAVKSQLRWGPYQTRPAVCDSEVSPGISCWYERPEDWDVWRFSLECIGLHSGT